MTEPAEPPPTMMVSYTLAFPPVVLAGKVAHLRSRVTPDVAGHTAAQKSPTNGDAQLANGRFIATLHHERLG